MRPPAPQSCLELGKPQASVSPPTHREIVCGSLRTYSLLLVSSTYLCRPVSFTVARRTASHVSLSVPPAPPLSLWVQTVLDPLPRQHHRVIGRDWVVIEIPNSRCPRHQRSQKVPATLLGKVVDDIEVTTASRKRELMASRSRSKPRTRRGPW